MTTGASSSAKKVRCPQCGGMALYSPDNRYRPFCSERCRLLDLGAWANDAYAIPGSPIEAPILAGDGSTDKSQLQ
jgi:endogenous inhibitor of DNA gyrase (YacG/DUF329 family)